MFIIIKLTYPSKTENLKRQLANFGDKVLPFDVIIRNFIPKICRIDVKVIRYDDNIYD